MTAPRSVLIALGAVVIVGVVAVAALRGVAPDASAPPPAPDPTADAAANAAATAIAADASAPTPTNSAADDAPPPWAGGAGATADGSTSAAAVAAPDSQRARQMAELQQSMSAVLDDALARSVSSSEHLRKALDALEAMDDPAVKAQINLPALRQNLELSVQMQGVAQQLKAEVGQPPSAERDARIEALRREFAALQARMRTDVAKGGLAAPMTLPAQRPAPLPLPPSGSTGP